MNLTAYTLLLRAIAPVIWASMAWSARRSDTHWGVLARERFGYAAPDDVHTAHMPGLPQSQAVPGEGRRFPVWVHAVSVGETRAAEPLIRALLARGDAVLLTHTTPTGRQTGQALFAGALARGQLRQAWMPYDFPGACRRFLTEHAPRFAVLIEREVWPNMVAACRVADVPVALVSARLSERGLRRTLRLGAVLKQAYAGLDIVCAQSEEDARRLQLAGVQAATVSGNLKFDVVLDAQQLARGRAWRQALGRPVVALVSTREGEDEVLAQAVVAVSASPQSERQRPLQASPPTLPPSPGQEHMHASPVDQHRSGPLVIWVPRHAQRFDEVQASIGRHGLSLVRRSVSADPPGAATQVYLGDTLGEMAFYLGAANVAVMGGSFAPLGAQNFIEACAAGVPVVLGPSVYNFQDAARDALAQGLVKQVADAGQALQLAWRICMDAHEQSEFGPRAQAWMGTHVGATQRILDRLPR